jgi:hypothetical protein
MAHWLRAKERKALICIKLGFGMPSARHRKPKRNRTVGEPALSSFPESLS